MYLAQGKLFFISPQHRAWICLQNIVLFSPSLAHGGRRLALVAETFQILILSNGQGKISKSRKKKSLVHTFLLPVAEDKPQRAHKRRGRMASQCNSSSGGTWRKLHLVEVAFGDSAFGDSAFKYLVILNLVSVDNQLTAPKGLEGQAQCLTGTFLTSPPEIITSLK